jgi:putative ATP-binding cassette transporter
MRYGGWRLASSVVAGTVGGAALAALMRLVHRALTLPQGEAGQAALQFAGLLAAYFVGTVVAEHALNDVAERLQCELRQSLLRQLMATPLREFERTGVTRLFSIVGGHVKVVSDYLCWLPTAVVNLAIVIGCFGYMAWLSPLVFGLNVGFVALAAACYIVPERAAQSVGRAALAVWNRHVSQMHFSLLASRMLLLSRAKRLDFLGRHFAPTAAEVRSLNSRHRLIHLLAERFAEAMVLGNVACLLFVLPRFMALSNATLTGLLLAALFVRAPLKSLLDVLPRTQGARLSLEQMSDVGLNAFDVHPHEGPAPTAPQRFRELVFDRVTFQYESDHDQAGFACGPFTLSVHAGEVLFIVGGNGAGKTTLAKLLCGLYPPAAGTVTLDGQAVTTDTDRTALRERFAAVFTEDPLFEHVLGVSPETAERRATEFIAELKLGHKVSMKGTQFSTIDLSQGQRRRLSLLGALLDDRPILLLDEWAADQDPEFRAFFYGHIVPELKAQGKTVILITHDDRFFGQADRVMKLDLGKLDREKTA